MCILTLCEQARVLSLSLWFRRLYNLLKSLSLLFCRVKMVARYPSTWNVEEDNLLNAAFATMAINCSRPKQEDLAQFLSDSLFPAGYRDTPWEIVNQTLTTVGGVPYFKMLIRLYNGPLVWLCNPQILQVRVKLGLNNLYCVARGLGNNQLGEFAAKIEAIRAIVGTKRLTDCYELELVRHPTQWDFPNLANEQAMSLCSAGLRARRNRNEN